MCTRKLSYGNIGIVNISTANSNLNGTGTLGTVLTSGHDGTEITSITIKATQSTTQGMVRLFITSGGNTRLYKEVKIPAIDSDLEVIPTFQTMISGIIILDNGDVLKASTQNAESFTVLAAGSDWDYCACSDSVNCCDQGDLIANTGIANISTANSNLDGSGVIGTIITAPSSANFNCTQVDMVTIKATQTTSQGMVRLFIFDGTNSHLIKELPIPATKQLATYPTYSTTAYLGLSLPTNYELRASTQWAENFNLFTFGIDMTNCPCPE